MQYLEPREFANSADFLAALKTHRLANKGQWIAFAGKVGNREVSLKSFGASYLQILDVDGIRHGGAMDMKVRDWNAAIEKALA
jgi:hypothetical protein